MTVASSTSKSGPYAGDGATTVFAFNFKVQQAADIKVVRTVTSNGTQLDTTLASGADYTVAVNGDQSASPGGNVTMTSAPAVGQQITILRNVTATQGTSIPNQGGFYPKVLENALDKLTMLVQQLSEESNRALKLSVADSITNLQDLLVRLNTAVADAESAAGSAGTDSDTAAASAASASDSAIAAQEAAVLAQEAADSISGGPVTSVNGMTGVVTGLALASDLTPLASKAGVETLQNKTLTSPELTTAPYMNGSVRGNVVAVAALDIDCSAGNYFTKTINGSSTFTFSNAPASRSYGFTLELTHTSGTVAWPAAVKWPGDTAPTLSTGKTHLFVFVTDDGGTRWRGASLTNYTN